jgi:S1-C subfamily serine protease
MDGKTVVGYKGAYTRNEQGRIVPFLTTKIDAPQGTILDLVASGGSGSGFVVDERGFIATNRHVASNWLTSFHFQDYAFPGLLVGYDAKGNLTIDPNAQVNRQDVGDWVPGNDKKYTGVNTYLDVTFANNSQRTPAKIVRISPTHDVAMIKIDLPETLPKVELYDSYNEIQPGDAAIVMGYPGIAPAQLVLKRSQDVFNTNPNITTVPVPTISNGNVGRMVRGTEKNSKIDDYMSTFGDYYQLTINSTGGGNSGGPMFDDKGRVVGVFSAGKWEPGAAISFAVPVKYVMELMGRQEVIK